MTTKTITKNAISIAAVQSLSDVYSEPAWLRQARIAAWETFEAMPWPTYKEETWRRTRLTGFKLENYGLPLPPDIRYAARQELPEHLREELAKIDSAGALVLQDGRAIYHELDEALSRKGVLFTDLRSALVEHQELVKVHLAAQVPADENKFAALHYALWLNGTFLFIIFDLEVAFLFPWAVSLGSIGILGFWSMD
ncbi:MAG TPA: hypothetical protein EYP25_09340 [Anaerolineae bacterium]|nr:hypothetical protein [Anaerolineae bacterium]